MSEGGSIGTTVPQEKSNEITAIPLLLDSLHLENSLVTLDAMGCQTKIAQHILDQKGDYLLVLKANHRHDYQTVKSHFLDGATPYPNAKFLCSDAFEESHGPLVRRRVFVSQDATLLAALSHWPELNMVLALTVVHACMLNFKNRACA